MTELDIDGLRKIQLEILDFTAKFCDEHGINYWLDGGTLIGAVRHKGYIPWDDDIDIGMMRQDYEKFTELFTGQGRFKFIRPEKNSEYYAAHGKVLDTDTILYEPDEKGNKLAVYIDIFVYDNAPDDARITKKMFRLRSICYVCNVARQARIFQPPKGGIMRRLCVYALRLAVRIFPRGFFVRKILENAKRYSDSDTKKIGNFLGVAKMTCNKSALSEFIESEFEGRKYKIPAGYDEYLREFYGDYMQLPPPEKRVSTHVFKAYKP